MTLSLRQQANFAPPGFIKKTRTARNTGLFLYPDGTKVTILYRTKILIEAPDGTLTLSTGGFKTATTKDRLNRSLPPQIHVCQRDYEWFVNTSTRHIPFEDGMVINRD
jgi:hypothetical protein